MNANLSNLKAKLAQDSLRKFRGMKATSTAVEQVGGEEVIVTIPTAQFPELFGVEV